MSDAAPRTTTAVLVSGGGTNLQAIIDASQDGSLPIELCAVLSDRADAFGLERARRAGIKACAVDYGDFQRREDAETALLDQLDDCRPELVVLAGFMRILPDAAVARYHGRMLNIHPSLLPKYRGLHTFRRVLAAGDRWHGSTVHFVVPELDAGPAIIQYRIAVSAEDTEDSLRQRVQAGEYLIYPRAIAWYASGRLRLKADKVMLDEVELQQPVLVDES